MLAFRSRSAVTRVRAIRGSLGVCSLLPKSNFSAAALLSQETTEETFTSNPGTEAVTPDVDPEPRIPLSIQSVWYRPFRRKAEYGLPVCDLQIRSYSVRNLEFMCDFALRAAYYLNLPASGPVPLPRRTERWTVPRGHFAHKKSQENFERVTYKRLIQIKDGHPETVEIWLAYLKKHQFYGTGMKANVWGFEELGVGKRMNVSLDNLRDVATKPKWAHSGVRKTLETAEKVAEILNSPEYRALANKTDTEEAERELLQAAPLETVKLEGASEAEVDETIQKVGEEAMKAEESKEVAEVNEVDPIVDEMAELEEPTGFGAQPIDEVKVETQTDPLGPSSMIDDIVTTSSQAAEVPKPPPVTQTQEEVLAAFTPEVIPSEAKEVTDPPQDPSSDQAEGVVATPAPAETLTAATALAVDVPEDTAPEERLVETIGATPLPPEASATDPAIGTPATGATPTQDSCTGPSGTVAPVLEEELRPEAEPQDKAAQAAPEATRAQKAEAEVEMEVKKVAEETAAYELTREGAHDLKPEKKD
ncbi:hypothetical protein C7212DRAFT_277498 [Tuber magnatum]|uniref:Small ribosomal subunit protein uS10m n=1 Tax=Tuber magnatum TaxID=42249 RepID=A0A317SVW7_9PEZI|nr:hypothetical protein C7212DRAFT_277498 [Tuber magnatum]